MAGVKCFQHTVWSEWQFSDRLVPITLMFESFLDDQKHGACEVVS